MPVSEYGEIGCLIQHDPEGNMVIEWRIRKIETATHDSPLYGWKKGDTVYLTSLGWMTAPDEAVFMPKERERSLKPCTLRAIDYAKNKYPNVRIETH